MRWPTGPWVDDALKPHIFRQGFSSKPDRKLHCGYRVRTGLFLVAGYINKAGGSIEIADNTPQGTIFCIYSEWAKGMTQALDVVIVEMSRTWRSCIASILSRTSSARGGHRRVD